MKMLNVSGSLPGKTLLLTDLLKSCKSWREMSHQDSPPTDSLLEMGYSGDGTETSWSASLCSCSCTRIIIFLFHVLGSTDGRLLGYAMGTGSGSTMGYCRSWMYEAELCFGAGWGNISVKCNSLHLS